MGHESVEEAAPKRDLALVGVGVRRLETGGDERAAAPLGDEREPVGERVGVLYVD